MSTPEDRQSLSSTQHLQSAITDRDPASPTNGARAEGEQANSDLRHQERIRRWAERARARAVVAQQTAEGSAASESVESPIPAAQPSTVARLGTAIASPGQGPRDTTPPRRVVELKPLPKGKRKRSLGALISFILCVIAPVIAATVYYFAFASDQYVSEFSFVVRDSKSAASGASTGAAPAIMSMISGAGSSVENYMVAEYLLSREAVEALQSRLDIVKMYSRPDIDWLARLDPSAPIERIVPYWRRMVTATYDQITGLGVAQVRAFEPKDAYEIASTLVKLSETLVNEIANRPQRDAVRFAEDDVRRAEERLRRTRSELATYRDKELLIEPQADAVAGKIAVAQTLRTSLANLETELVILQGSNMNANSSQIVGLKKRIEATRAQLKVVESQVGTARDGSTPLSKVVGEYERLDLERQFAQNILNAAVQNLEQARSNALVQHIYVTAFIAPGVPQSSTYPKRITSILLFGLGCMLFWTVGLLIIGSVREHVT